VSHVGCLVELTSYPEVTNFDVIIFCQKHIYCLDVTMKDSVRMQVLYAKTHLNKELPNALLSEIATFLLFEVESKVTVLA
jgi:hypothetical protein